MWVNEIEGYALCTWHFMAEKIQPFHAFDSDEKHLEVEEGA